MSGRLTYMKYTAIVAVAVVSLLVAIPLSKQSVKQQTDLSFKPVSTKVAVKKVPISTPAAKPISPSPVTPVAKPATPVSSPSPQIVVASYRCEAYQSYFEQYNWNVDTAMAICQAESSGIASNVSNGNINPDGISDYGLMQLHGVDILDPAANIAYAYYHKYLTQGWGAWSTYNTGKYAQFL